MSVIRKAKHFAIGIGVVCLLIAGGGGFIGYGGVPAVGAEEDIPALWEEIRQSPDPGEALVALGVRDGEAKWALIQYVGRDEAASQQFMEFWEARPRFWYEFREDGSGTIKVTPRYPELLAGIDCDRCFHKLLAEQLPEYPVMEVFEKEVNIMMGQAGMPPGLKAELKARFSCPVCLEKDESSAESIALASVAAEPEPL